MRLLAEPDNRPTPLGPTRGKVANAAKATGDSILVGLVEGTFAQDQTAPLEQLFSELGEATNSYMVSHLRYILTQRLALIPRIKAGVKTVAKSLFLSTLYTSNRRRWVP